MRFILTNSQNIGARQPLLTELLCGVTVGVGHSLEGEALRGGELAGVGGLHQQVVLCEGKRLR